MSARKKIIEQAEDLNHLRALVQAQNLTLGDALQAAATAKKERDKAVADLFEQRNRRCPSCRRYGACFMEIDQDGGSALVVDSCSGWWRIDD